jgi:hypothetical protein
MCFLWENAYLNISVLKYDVADLVLRDLLEMAVVCKSKRIIALVFEKISLVYYYRGNLVMSQYYMQKVHDGLSSF